MAAGRASAGVGGSHRTFSLAAASYATPRTLVQQLLLFLGSCCCLVYAASNTTAQLAAVAATGGGGGGDDDWYLPPLLIHLTLNNVVAIIGTSAFVCSLLPLLSSCPPSAYRADCSNRVAQVVICRRSTGRQVVVPLSACEQRTRQLHDSLVVGASASSFVSPADVAGRVLADMAVTVGQQAEAWQCPALPSILRVPLPYRYVSTNPYAPAPKLELMPPAGRAETLAEVRREVHTVQEAGVKDRNVFMAVTGVSGVGKTKVAYDVGLRHAFTVMSCVAEQGVLTPPWLAYYTFAAALVATATRGDDGLPPLVERVTLKAALIVLFAAHLEWVVAVSEAAVSGTNRGAFAAAAAGVLAADAADADGGTGERRAAVLREVVMRAQRNGPAYGQIATTFRRAMLSLLDVSNSVADNGTLTITVGAATAYLGGIVGRARAVWGIHGDRDPFIVWAHDEVDALLGNWGLPSGLFHGVYTPGGASVPAASGTPPSPPPSAPLDRCNWFHGVLAAIRDVAATVHSSHLLLGASLGLQEALLYDNSPAQGNVTVTQQAVRLSAAELREWYARYLTPAAMRGIQNNDLAALVGRPLFGSLFWAELIKCGRGASVGDDPAAAVRAALAATVEKAQAAAVALLTPLWERHTSNGYRDPSRLLRMLFYGVIMVSPGACTSLAYAHHDAKEAIGRILNVRGGADGVRLADEPVMAAALRTLGVARVRAGNDDVKGIIDERELADEAGYATTCVTWALVRACLRAASESGHGGWVPLLGLLRPYLAWDATTENCYGTTLHPALHPFGENEFEVNLTEGRRGDAAEWTGRSPFSILAEHPTALVYHTSTAMAGPSIMLLARRCDSPDVTVPVLLQFETSITGELTPALDALDLGKFHPDDERGEVPAHTDMRRTLAAHPAWALPIRCVASTSRAFHHTLLHDVAWLNCNALDGSPLVLMHVPVGDLGACMEPTALTIKRPRANWPACARPSRVRHWGGGAELPALPDTPDDLHTATLTVRFSSGAASLSMVQAAVDAVVYEVAGEASYTLDAAAGTVTATFTHAASAISTLWRCRNRRLTAGGAPIAAEFSVGGGDDLGAV